MDGLVYLLDQAGRALAQTNEHIARLEQQVAELNAERQAPTHGDEVTSV